MPITGLKGCGGVKNIGIVRLNSALSASLTMSFNNSSQPDLLLCCYRIFMNDVIHQGGEMKEANDDFLRLGGKGATLPAVKYGFNSPGFVHIGSLVQMA